MPPRIVFMGSPDFAIPTLRALAQTYPIVGIVTQPDREAGRGRALTPPPIKLLAQEMGIPFIQPQKMRQEGVLEQLNAWHPEVIVVVAFGQILRADVLSLPPHGCINVHASLLPRWRGAAPIQACLLHGDAQTGVTIMRMDTGVDTGPILHQKSLPIEPEETAGTLSDKLANLGAELLIETLPDYLAGKIKLQAQEEARVTHAPMLKKEDGNLDFTESAVHLERRVRAFQPWPGAFTAWQGQTLKVQRVSVMPPARLKQPASPGQHLVVQGKPAISTGDGLLILEEVQPAGKKLMSGKAFLAGARNWV